MLLLSIEQFFLDFYFVPIIFLLICSTSELSHCMNYFSSKMLLHKEKQMPFVIFLKRKVLYISSKYTSGWIWQLYQDQCKPSWNYIGLILNIYMDGSMGFMSLWCLTSRSTILFYCFFCFDKCFSGLLLSLACFICFLV